MNAHETEKAAVERAADGSQAAYCLWCGKAMAIDPAKPREIIETMRSHDMTCPQSPVGLSNRLYFYAITEIARLTGEKITDINERITKQITAMDAINTARAEELKAFDPDDPDRGAE